jgi:nucleotide-binding universal stress UspA family protein
MKVLCALGARDGAALVQRLLAQLGGRPLDLTLVFVIDEGPRHGIEALRGPLQRGPRLDVQRRAQMRQAEERTGEVVLAEARAAAEGGDGVAVTTRLLRGRPERVIVDLAGQGVDLVVVSAREGVHAPLAGPESIGHVARYVLDHAACDVLLLRR